MKSKQDQRNYIIIGLCLILVIMGVGYAAFSSLLTINGTANISNSWCVGFDNTKNTAYTAKAGITGGTTPTGSITFSGSTCGAKYQPDASLTATFKQPGDQIEYTLTIKNKSTVPVAIKSIQVENNSVTTDTTIKKGNIEFIVHMPETTNLAVDGETTMRVVARFQNETDVTGPYDGEQKTLNIKINAEQGTGTEGMVTSFTGSVYRHNTNKVHNGDNIKDTGTIWVIANTSTGGEYADEYNTEEECQTGYEGKNPPAGYSCQAREKGLKNYTEDASTLNKTYYLKHDIVEDVVTNSYICFIYNNTEHCMKGADSGASFAQNTQIIKDFQTFNNLGAYNYNGGNPTGCTFAASSSRCYGGGIYYMLANSTGSVYAYGSSNASCYVLQTGYSSCDV
ncbi:MAG: hypothetical protein IKE90_02830 [Bacilli bacterium]|nr:hypothetical protein [Bacilli bacterium]